MGDTGLKQRDGGNRSPGSPASFIEVAELSSTAMVYSTYPKSPVLPDIHNSVCSSVHLKPLALQSVLDQCAGHLDQECLNLSLSIVEEDRRTKATTSTCFDQKDNCSTQNVIDLGVSPEGISNVEGNNSACTDRFISTTKSKSPISSGKMENSSCPFGNDGKYSPGFRDYHKALMVDKSSLKDSISHEAGILDLNQVLLDDSLYYSSDNLVTCHATASSLSIFGVSLDSTQERMKSVNCGNTKDDELSRACKSSTAEKLEDASIHPALLCQSRCFVDNSGSLKTKQLSTYLGDADPIASERHLGAGDGNEPRHDCLKMVELPEVSMSIQTEAQLLINFSAGNSSSYRDCSSKVESIKVDKEEREKLECSDSYEQIALELEECDADDCSVSSKAYEIDSTEENRNFGFRLKRGRRFRDFRKEILPCLASLSRHEIQEDINIMEAVLRSREYRKIGARMGDQRIQCVAKKGKQSKKNFVRRKIL